MDGWPLSVKIFMMKMKTCRKKLKFGMNTYCEKMRVPKTRANNPKSKKKPWKKFYLFKLCTRNLNTHTHTHKQAFLPRIGQKSLNNISVDLQPPFLTILLSKTAAEGLQTTIRGTVITLKMWS